MKNDKYIQSAKQIEPDESARERMLYQIMSRSSSGEPKTRKVSTMNKTMKWLAPVAACLVIAVAAIFTIPKFANDRPVDINLPSNGGDQISLRDPRDLSLIFGLPAIDYARNDAMTDRMVTDELRYLLRELDNSYKGSNAAVAIATVLEAESFKDSGGKGQISTVSIEGGYYGDELGKAPLKIKQYLFGGCAGIEQTNLLRRGGVYVLPLVKMQNDEYWQIYGDLDCLFEVDDKNLVHSHSAWEKLNKYDGEPLAALWNDILYLTENPILRSTFAEDISRGYFVETLGDTVFLKHPAAQWSDGDKNAFTAKIGEDGRISIATTNDGGFNVFKPLAGMTVEEMNAAISQIKEYAGTAKD